MATKWTEYDYRALIRAAAEIGARPLDLLLVLFSESRLDPGAIAYVGGAPYARGLNQITPPAAKGMGLSDDEWASLSAGMTPAEQLPYVVRCIKLTPRISPFHDAGELYQLNFAPASLAKGTGDDLVLYSGGAAYQNNKGFDTSGKGYITVGDLRAHLRKLATYADFKKHADALRAVDPALEGPVVEGPSGGFFWKLAAGFAGVVVALGAGWYFWKEKE